ncbi:MAG: copper oxidase [Marinilabiliales bacterium]|nr:MAG: copper oxidase [Marinilabiliales bacterium]
MKNTILIVLLFLLFNHSSLAQVGTNGDNRKEKGRPIKEYNLVLEQKSMTLGGIKTKAMTVNASIPGPTLEFNEGDLAIINVTNRMKVETSIHWHGIILPNFYDGVPYLTTPPIKPNETFQYRIPINQSGTYWYHSHTMLQEQKGVYGSIVIHPRNKTLEYDTDLAIILSDWTNEKPNRILRNLKRGNEWYQIKKGTAVPLIRAITQGGFSAQIKMWRDRMEGADIADIYYPTFLSNGKKLLEYSDLKSGDKIRLRFINASASTYFWMDFGAGDPIIVSSDGINVEPVHKNRFLFAIAETYDIIVTIPDGKLEIIATAQDGSGYTKIHLGKGKLYPASVISKPDKVEMMKQMANMDMKMGAPTIISNRKKKTPTFLLDKYGMNMHMEKENNEIKSNTEISSEHKIHMTPNSINMRKNDSMRIFTHNERMKHFNYDFLKAKNKTTFDEDIPVNELLLNLTGNMNRYIWSLNGIPLSESDKIKIESGKITRIVINNITMMHHPMHLHGHYFRVINENGNYSPLKHTVNIPPMQKVTIEFYNEEEGDWFFHCHVLYHMMSGMARIFSYDTPKDQRMEGFSIKNIIKETDHYYTWGLAQLGSNFSEISFTSSNVRNEFNLFAESYYNLNSEIELNYNRYLNDWVRIYAGVNAENEVPNSFDEYNFVSLVGIKYFTPYMFNIDLSLDHQLRPILRINKELLLFSRVFIEGAYEFRADFGYVNSLENGKNYVGENKWHIQASFMISRNLSIQTNYHSDFGLGGGLNVRF